MDYSLTLQDIRNILKNNIQAFVVSDLHKYNSLEEIMGGNKAVMILYDYSREGSNISGHWCCLVEIDPQNLAFYDSYGKSVDYQLDYIPKEYRDMHNMTKNELTRLLYYSKYKNLHYNPYTHQKGKTATCGRHCAMFIKKRIDPEDYNKLIKQQCTRYNISPDKLVYLATKKFINK